MSAEWLLVLTLTFCGESASLALERDEFGRVAVEVGLGTDGRYRFLLDTGSSLSSLSPRLATRLRLARAGRVRATSVGEDGTLALVRAPEIILGTRRLAIPWMAVLPDAIDHPLSRFDGILGQDVLRQFSYLIDASTGRLCVDPPPWLVGTFDFARLDVVAPAGPLKIRADASPIWTLDTGASHVVLFGDATPAGGRPNLLVSAMGARPARWTAPATVTLGTVQLRWTTAVTVPASGRSDRGLLPLSIFDAIYVDTRHGAVWVRPHGSGSVRNPDVAADLGALESDARVVGRPRRVPDVAVGNAK